MKTAFQKFTKAILVSSIVAVATPALAAGLVAGAASAVKVVADAGPISQRATITSDIQSDVAPSQDVVASNGPRRLSALAGSDEQAWASARDVHVRTFAHKR